MHLHPLLRAQTLSSQSAIPFAQNSSVKSPQFGCKLEKRDGVTDKYFREVGQAYKAEIPVPIRDTLQKSGWVMAVAPFVISEYPDSAGRLGKGHGHDFYNDNAAGQCHTGDRNITIPRSYYPRGTRQSDAGAEARNLQDVSFVIRHEVAHAVDHQWAADGQDVYSSSEAFQQALDKDLAFRDSLNDEAKKPTNYLRPEPGEDEADYWAEIFAEIGQRLFKINNMDTLPDTECVEEWYFRDNAILATFSHVTALIKQRLEQTYGIQLQLDEEYLRDITEIITDPDFEDEEVLGELDGLVNYERILA